VQLLKDLLNHGIPACGTVRPNRKGFPVAMTNIKEFEKRSKRGDMRWHRDDTVLTVQWRKKKLSVLCPLCMKLTGQQQ